MTMHPRDHRRLNLRSRLIFLVLLGGFILLFQLPVGWSNAADAPATAVVATKLSPGLTLTFGSNGAVDARDARLVALLVPAGTPASPFLPVGPFKATWTGVITTRIKDTYRFAAEGRGTLSFTLNDKPVLNLTGDFTNQPSLAIVLKKGKNRLVVTYQSAADGDANVRLLWATEGKPFEPIPPTSFSHDATNDVLARHTELRAGRELVATMRCMNCHQGTTGSMPESKQDAPNLTDIKSRLNANWVAYWVANPKALRPTASMPRVFRHDPAKPEPSTNAESVDVAAYLCGPSENQADATAVTTDPAILARGARVFTGLGCVACHVAPAVTDSDPTLNRVPLKYVRAKFKAGALHDFLLKPEAHYAWIKMPNFHLTEAEATAVAAWLWSGCKADALPPPGGIPNAANGKMLFETSGCLNCHATGDVAPKPAAVVDLTRADWSHGCAMVGSEKGVDYAFTPEQQQALHAFAATEWKPTLDRDPLPEFASRQMTALRCNACHSVDANDNVWANLDTEINSIQEGLPPRPPSTETKGNDAAGSKIAAGSITVFDTEPQGDQSRPPLTWTGEKLRPSWAASFIAGKVSYKPRMWIAARMPAFASRADLLAQGMAMSHGCPVTDEVRPPVDQPLAEIGKPLTSQTSFGCVKCHACGDQPAVAPFEAFAPNLSHVSDRLKHSYYTHWMRNPQYYLPGTKMPSFADADGNTPYKEVLNGVAADQYEAIWQYIQAGDHIVPAQ